MITIIGNGESRKDIDIDRIRGMKVGCNGIYLHNKVDLICAMDKFWRDKISSETNIPLLSRYHNTAWQNKLELYEGKWKNTNCPYRGYCSGISALDYISSLGKNDIYLIGFDFGYKGDKVNHIYKDTKFHPPSNRPAQNETIFLRQFIQTIKRYPRVKYTWVTDSNFSLKEFILYRINKITVDEYKELAYEKIIS